MFDSEFSLSLSLSLSLFFLSLPPPPSPSLSPLQIIKAGTAPIRSTSVAQIRVSRVPATPLTTATTSSVSVHQEERANSVRTTSILAALSCAIMAGTAQHRSPPTRTGATAVARHSVRVAVGSRALTARCPATTTLSVAPTPVKMAVNASCCLIPHTSASVTRVSPGPTANCPTSVLKTSATPSTRRIAS